MEETTYQAKSTGKTWFLLKTNTDTFAFPNLESRDEFKEDSNRFTVSPPLKPGGWIFPRKQKISNEIMSEPQNIKSSRKLEEIVEDLKELVNELFVLLNGQS